MPSNDSKNPAAGQASLPVLLTAVRAGFAVELLQLRRAPLFVALTVLQAVTFLFLVTLYGLTGSRAPTAVVLSDHGRLSPIFLKNLEEDHHSFALRRMLLPQAMPLLRQGQIVAVINIQDGFTESIDDHQDTVVNVAVDNVDTDMTDDIQRALPAAIVAFGDQMHLPGITLRAQETDLIDHDTGFIPYLVVSGLVLDAFVIAGILPAMTIAREFENGGMRHLALTPGGPMPPLAGRALAAAMASAVAMAIPTVLIVAVYGVHPRHPVEMIGAILLCIAVFACVGIALGALVKRTLPVASLVFGLALPLYICSGSLEPSRFDGPVIWLLAHASPVYYGVGVLEHAVNGLQVTPEPISTDIIGLILWAIGMIAVATLILRRAASGTGDAV